jgi:serine phosphatase RsbU (regulator of sigma subunit)
MSQSLFQGRLAAKRALDVRTYPTRRQNSSLNKTQELAAKLEELQKDYIDLHTAIFEAAQVHRRLCAPRLLRYGEFEIASEIFAVRHLPGDFFTVKPTDNGVVMALGDICGKGLAAGMWTTHLVGSINHYSALSSEPNSIVTGVNRDFCRSGSETALASLFLARLDQTNGHLDYCSAGHPPTLLLRANGELELLTEGGLLLGVEGTAPYLNGTVELRSGDALLVYSDGILESQDQDGGEFGYDRLEAELRRAREASADAMLFSVLGAVQDFAAIRPLSDDMTLVVIKRD